MNFQIKLFLVIATVLILCRLCPCNAQDNYSANQLAVPATNFSSTELNDNSVVSYTKSTGIGNIEFSLRYLSDDNSFNTFKPYNGFASVPQQGLLPQITIFTNRQNKQSDFQPVVNNHEPSRSDRYKDTIPVIYRVTLKGYSIMELTDNRTNAWSLNKVKDKSLRNSEIQFSITKYF